VTDDGKQELARISNEWMLIAGPVSQLLQK
jgi:hypothetical protein